MSEPAYLAGLNHPQRAAVEHRRGPLLILAGAGSGKTRVLTRRVAHLIACGVNPWNILAVTFTNKAAEEMKARVTQLIGEPAKDVWVSTFHSTCVRILRRDIEQLGASSTFTILDDDDQNRVLKGVIGDLGLDDDKLTPRRMRGLIDRAKNRMIGPREFARIEDPDRPPRAAEVYERYEERLRASNALDFNDLINRVVQLFATRPEVLARWQGRFRNIMVDEYQDTNRAQYELVRLLSSTRDRNLVVVGDDDQSIYSFRGADIRNILDFERDYPEAKVVRLEQNYRSSDRILSAAMDVVRNNHDRKRKELWTRAELGEPLRELVGKDEEEEGQRVSVEVRMLLGQGYKPSDIALIYRTNARSRVFETALSQARVPFVVVGARRFYERKEVKDVLAYLRVLVNYTDEASLFRILNVPRRGIGSSTENALRDRMISLGLPPLEAARALAAEGGRAGKALSSFVALIDRLRVEMQHRSPGELLLLVAEESGLLPELRANQDEESVDRIRNIEELARDSEVGSPPDDGAPRDDSPIARLRDFLDRVTLVGQDSELPSDEGRVTLMTAHLAKGLEYPVVFVCGLVQGSFPLTWGANAERDLEEERRLMYVALTRAQQRLYLTRPVRRRSWGERSSGEEFAERSVFLQEIRPERFERQRRAPTAPLPDANRQKLEAFLAGARPRPAAPAEAPAVRTTRVASEPSDFRVGARILHPRFGEGVISSKRILPGMISLLVTFNKGGTKTIDPRLDPVEIIVH